MQPLRIAFMGFRHGHITALYTLARQREDLEIVASCEEHPETREALAAGGRIAITHTDFEALLREVDCDVVAVGDYYEKRGRCLRRALEGGRHVIADKPLCTRLSELEALASLARSRSLSVGCMLDFRSLAPFRKVRELIQAGEIGEVHAVSFNGQHPLCYGSRPAWYFEPGKHGGTFNDIGIHAVDYLPWATGQRFTRIEAARSWNASLPQVPGFADCAQAMLTLERGGGVLGDVSYLAPDSFGYRLPQYWRLTFWGSGGVLEASANLQHVLCYRNGEKEARTVSPGEGRPGGYLEDFVREIRGETEGLELTTRTVLESSRVALQVQDAADRGLRGVPL